MTLPKKLLEQGVTDMVRISDGRMSGTAYGTVVLHVSPESAIGGVLALVKDGDWIELDVEARRLHLDVSDEELALRKSEWRPGQGDVGGSTGKGAEVSGPARGYVYLYRKHVQQAHLGADLDFLCGGSGSEVSRDSH